MHLLTDPWKYAFFRHGLEAGTLAGALCGLVGVYVVLRRMSYIGHGLSHAPVKGIMSARVATASEDAPLAELQTTLASALPLSTAVRAFLSAERRRDFPARLRVFAFSACRCCFSAERVFAM